MNSVDGLTNQQPMSSKAAVVALRTALKNLIFTLENEKYGIPISSVKEVIGLPKITPVTHVPSFFKDLINLRSKINSILEGCEKLVLDPFLVAKNYGAQGFVRKPVTLPKLNNLMLELKTSNNFIKIEMFEETVR